MTDRREERNCSGKSALCAVECDFGGGEKSCSSAGQHMFPRPQASAAEKLQEMSSRDVGAVERRGLDRERQKERVHCLRVRSREIEIIAISGF